MCHIFVPHSLARGNIEDAYQPTEIPCCAGLHAFSTSPLVFEPLSLFFLSSYSHSWENRIIYEDISNIFLVTTISSSLTNGTLNVKINAKLRTEFLQTNLLRHKQSNSHALHFRILAYQFISFKFIFVSQLNFRLRCSI